MLSTRKKNKTWREKLALDNPAKPRIVEIPDRWAKRIGHGRMVILTPRVVDHFIKTIPRGNLVTFNLIREKFANQYRTDVACPLTTGIFVWISAGAAEESKSAGVKRITPYWRVLKEGGKLNPKFPGGVIHQARYLRSEGFQLIKGKSDAAWRVKDYEKFLMPNN